MCGPSCQYSTKLLTSNKLENTGDVSQMLCNYLNFKKGATTDREHRCVKMTAVVCTKTIYRTEVAGLGMRELNNNSKIRFSHLMYESKTWLLAHYSVMLGKNVVCSICNHIVIVKVDVISLLIFNLDPLFSCQEIEKSINMINIFLRRNQIF